MYFPYYFDWTYLLVIIGALICGAASTKVRTTYAKYSQVGSQSGLTGAQVARKILNDAGLYDVQIEHIAGSLTDNYDPRSRVLHLSDTTYASPSIAAIGVAAHECGHAIQHKVGYAPLNLRSAFVPVAQFGSTIAWPLIIVGLLLQSSFSHTLLTLGVWAFALSVIFQLITLPVEFDASRRAINILGNTVLAPEEVEVTRQVLSAAALTYVAGAAAGILNLLRVVAISNRRR